MTLFKRFNFLYELKKVLDKANIPFWIDFGTLLGFYRQGDFIETDPDIDIGIKREYQEDVIEIADELSQLGKVVVRVDKGDGCHYLAGFKIMRDDIWIDVAFYFECGDKYIWPISQWDKVMTFDKKYFDNLVDLEVKGVKFKIPSDTENLIITHYGEDWRRPFEAGEEYDLHKCSNVENNKKYLKCLK